MGTLPVKIEMTERQRINIASIFRDKKDQLTGFINRRIRDLAEAEDIVQEVFYKLVAMYDTIESVDSWIYTVARNKITDHYRKRKVESIDSKLPGSEEEYDELSSLLPDFSSSPDQMYFDEAVWEQLNEALDELPDLQREAFVLHQFEDYSIKEIAELQHTSVNTVLSRKRYAIQHLRNRLFDFYNDLKT